MSENEKNTAVQNGAENNDGEVTSESAAEKKKKRFTVQSPYADYAADNDKVSEMMEEGEEPVQPTAKGLLQTVLAAIGLVGMFIGVALMFSMMGNCLGAK